MTWARFGQGHFLSPGPRQPGQLAPVVAFAFAVGWRRSRGAWPEA